MSLPKDPVILLSYINTQLRDSYASLDDLCHSLNLDRETLEQTMKKICYEYESGNNQFVAF